ncbi:hypothetical protein TPHA_0A00250 [Tetrapisispora phaffii CBS 4417]|uniref:Spt20-like SEP domain-containing protein n=1 Tax=Tetrapisispora phaffii (strain ATCC 24235 / CBS 4417 / NBRC 1672 / NRRL Y-8282 / UCD 70-5) TaxID=1071381 RepID=G8BMI2_TETPH|nr:hypothetical protein TPHA_0A00250 [Tetrapisispora phaffii CBS 4417]CCE61110.1 hypothetical protein TPHA_0A00250 [Tetrapisispora phaffii CBS 4417]
MENANLANFPLGVPVNQANQMNRQIDTSNNNMMSPSGQSPLQQQIFGSPVNRPQQLNQNQQLKNVPASTNINNNVPSVPQMQANQKYASQNISPQQQMLQQKILQQKKQQQAMINYENQFHQMSMTINKKPKRLYNFVEDINSILQKYKQYKPSFEFHIFENNYKICAPANTRLQQQQKSPELNSEGLILTKNNPMLKEFLEYVARSRIPEAIMEVLKDCNIQFYEGNLILQVYDHTNTVDIKTKENKATANTPSSATQPDQNTNGPGNNVDNVKSTTSVNATTDSTNDNNNKNSNDNRTNMQKIDNSTTIKRPRVYRTLLRPNDLTTYCDMMTYADQSRFSDSIYQLLEAELLAITKRNILLDVPLNPYGYKDNLEADAFIEPIKVNDDPKDVRFCHREVSNIPGSKGVVGHIEQFEELPQRSSNYEQLMLIAADRTTSSTLSTLAIALTKQALGSSNNKSSLKNNSALEEDYVDNKLNGEATGKNSNKAKIAAAAANANNHNDNNQFSRIKFIEQWKLNKKKMTENPKNNSKQNFFNMKISMTSNSSTNIQNMSEQDGYKPSAKQAQGKQTKGRGAAKRVANSTTGANPKAKKPRKNAKKADGETQAKKKRVTKKKQAAGASNTKATKANNKANASNTKTK